MTPSDEYPHGWDVEWVAVDAQDRIAIFTTAGENREDFTAIWD